MATSSPIPNAPPFIITDYKTETVRNYVRVQTLGDGFTTQPTIAQDVATRVNLMCGDDAFYHWWKEHTQMQTPPERFMSAMLEYFYGALPGANVVVDKDIRTRVLLVNYHLDTSKWKIEEPPEGGIFMLVSLTPPKPVQKESMLSPAPRRKLWID